ncbi:MFS general substrate transporter [Filobasidium floriforme]|uniref:MFS general substrate transporter n=1 Tax=Filobasidium floriforme TaxID=5210 RepID=UPI001E8D563A|nr:MFS general substrate transporter [Filobasidium floriforme]KAH8083215.1 MFS general substrate transporter [Filobasidium floriforme]
MDTVSQLKADVITVNKVAAQNDETRYDHDDEKYHDEKHVDEEGAAAAPAGPPSEGVNDSASIVRKLTSKQELIVFSACCISLFQAGWNDASSGPLLPSLQARYEIRYLVMSIIFPVQCAGFITGALSNVWLTDRFGLGWVVLIGGGFQTLSFALNCWLPPYPLFVVAMFFNGVGTSLQDAQANSLTNRFRRPDVKMALIHAAYGLGATCSPFVSTLFVEHYPQRFYFYFLVSLALTIVNNVWCVLVYRFRTADQVLGPEPPEQVQNASGEYEEMAEQSSGDKMKRIMKLKPTWAIACHLLAYVGLEVTIGGWIVSYLREVRGGGVDSGYVATGFWGGLTVGRVIFVPLNRKIGEGLAGYFYLSCAVGLHFVVWFVPSVIGNAVAVSIIGVLLGPIYPIVMNACAKIFPVGIVTGAIGFVASFGAAGGAIFPFATGALADRFSIKVMQPCILALMLVCVITWFPIDFSMRKAARAKLNR